MAILCVCVWVCFPFLNFVFIVVVVYGVWCFLFFVVVCFVFLSIVLLFVLCFFLVVVAVLFFYGATSFCSLISSLYGYKN